MRHQRACCAASSAPHARQGRRYARRTRARTLSDTRVRADATSRLHARDGNAHARTAELAALAAHGARQQHARRSVQATQQQTEGGASCLSRYSEECLGQIVEMPR
jgi:hypothetical protein